MYTGDNIIIKELQLNFRSEWPRFYCYLNSWDVPEEFQHLSINDWVSEGNKHQLIREVMDYIQIEVGPKIISHYWNTIHRKDVGVMSDKEFEKWYEKDLKNTSFLNNSRKKNNNNSSKASKTAEAQKKLKKVLKSFFLSK